MGRRTIGMTSCLNIPNRPEIAKTEKKRLHTNAQLVKEPIHSEMFFLCLFSMLNSFWIGQKQPAEELAVHLALP